MDRRCRPVYGKGVLALKIGFDNQKYIELQKQHIQERISKFKGKLYLEFGGKLFDDYHAARVLPGFDVNGKIRLLYEMRDSAEIIFCVSADDIEKTKVRADLGISYDMEVLRLIDDITHMGIEVNSVVITRYAGQPAADAFVRKLTFRGVRNYIHRPIAGYPADIDHICSDEGYGANPYIETTKPLVVVTAPGPGSGKLATCLSQVYHEYRRGTMAGYAKFETFPIWNLPLKHPVNLAYEAATADLDDVNMIDPFHLEAYGETTVNYNRDVEAFPIVQNILTRITGDENFYRSPTDMGVNMAGYAVCDDEVVRYAACQEIIRRYYKAACDYRQGKGKKSARHKIERIMQQLGLHPEDRPCVLPARQRREDTGAAAAAIQLEDGSIVTGRASNLMSASSAAVLNAIKQMAGIDAETLLIRPEVLEPILKLKINILGSRSSVLKVDDVLAALSITAATNATAARAMEQLPALRDLDMHSSQMLHNGDEGTLRKLGLRLTCDPEYPSKDLYF
ncbi:MAG TPA: DUF1846 domain-containing protein [Candidatus Anaerofilum faecale]|nr:DUF1846 domain-containing protein [Candidatus Anaerofilum faecale]